MRTITITKEVYTFDELSDAAKDTARNQMRGMGDLWSSDEWTDSAKAFCEIAPISIKRYDFERAHIWINYNGPDLSGLRAWKWLQNNGWFDWAVKNKRGECTMTGFASDCAFADDLDKYRVAPDAVPDLQQVFYECAQSWVYAAKQDMEYAYSDAAIDEMIEANEYEFDSKGHMI